jgi:hypothetical protein
MKKLFLTLIVLTVAFAANAQIQIGVKAGLNIANLRSSDAYYVIHSNLSQLTSFNGGLITSVHLFADFFIQPEVYYSRQGLNGSKIMGEFAFKYDYLNVPVLLKYQFKCGPFIETGPQFGFLMSEKNVANGVSFDLNEVKNSDFSWAFGLGYQLKTFPLGLDFRYNLGLTDIYKDKELGVVKNSVYQIDLFWLFKVK